jgi:hypothetical protein
MPTRRIRSGCCACTASGPCCREARADVHRGEHEVILDRVLFEEVQGSGGCWRAPRPISQSQSSLVRCRILGSSRSAGYALLFERASSLFGGHPPKVSGTKCYCFLAVHPPRARGTPHS